MKVTLLGTGTSQGVPLIGCECKVCKSTDPKDKRLRSSIMIEVDDQVIIVDTGPDFRQQMLREKVKDIDAVLFTHHHKDHVAGMDDIRPFNFKWNKDINIFCSHTTSQALKREFHYVFSDEKYPGTPRVKMNIFGNQDFSIGKTIVQPIETLHYRMQVFGFRIYDFIYLTDVSEISSDEKRKLHNADLIILDALRIKPHMSHFNLYQALDLIDEIKPKRALLTHISHYMGLHKDVNKTLPINVDLSYDGQSIFI